MDFHITVSTAPKSKFNIENDLRLVKASLLYGDRVKLCSAPASLILKMRGFAYLPVMEQITMMEQMSVFAEVDPKDEFKGVATALKELLNKKYRGTKENQLLLGMKKNLPLIWEESMEKHKMVMQPALARELELAVKSELLELHDFQILKDTQTAFRSLMDGTLESKEGIKALSNEFTAAVKEAMADGSTYPLFDDQTGSLLKTAFDTTGGIKLSPARLSQINQSSLAADVLQRLPLFEDASMAEILDIRRELQKPLIRFRGAVMTYAEKIRTSAWDDDFTIEAEAVFRRDIEPSVLEIEDLIKSNPSLISLATRRLADKQTVFSSVFTFLISQAAALPYITAMAIAAGVGSAVAFNDAYHEWLKQKQSIEGNQLYFYYRANRFLAEGTHHVV
jgi:hypothetical protein